MPSSKKSVSNFFIIVIGLVVIFSVLKELQHIFIPFVIAILLTFIFEPLNQKLRSWKFPSFLAILVDILIVMLLTWGISNVILKSFKSFESAIPTYSEKLNNIISRTISSLGLTESEVFDFNILELAKELNVGGIAGGFFSSTLSIVSTTFFVLLFFVFVSSGYNQIFEAVKDFYSKRNTIFGSPSNNEEDVKDTFKNITSKVQHYILTKTLISFITSIIVGVILFFFDLDFLIVWIVLTLLLNFIPNIGSILAVLFPTVIALVQFESFGYALLIGGILAGSQNLIGNMIEPKIMGSTLGLNPIVILLSLLLWGYIWGIVGMFLAIPLTAVIKILISNSKSPNLVLIDRLMDN